MHGRPFHPSDVRTLHALGDRGGIRVIATGRALATARKVIPPEFPIDYLVFSSGAGILDWRTQELLTSHTMPTEDVVRATEALLAHAPDFMVHAPIPQQHIFQFHRSGEPNADFERRLARYAADGRVLDRGAPGPASQLIAVSAVGDPQEPFETLRRTLSDLSVIRATSPLDGRSIWIEVFAASVSKSQAASWIASSNGISHEHTAAIGNDYNDWDLLSWAARAAVVDNAPEAMRAQFCVVPSLHRWLESD